MSVVRVSGRWATLDTGDLVTAIPPASEYEHTSAFDNSIRQFQRDPEGFLSRYALVQRIPVWRSSRDLRAAYNQDSGRDS